MNMPATVPLRQGALRAIIAASGIWALTISTLIVKFSLEWKNALGQYNTSLKISAEGLSRPLDEIDLSIVDMANTYYERMESAKASIAVLIKIGIAVPVIVGGLIALAIWVWRGFYPKRLD